MLRVLRMNTEQTALLQRMLNAGPDVVRGVRGNRNWLLVREGSDQHQQLIALAAAGAVVRVRCAIKGIARYVATCIGGVIVGLNDKELDRAIRCAACVGSGACRSGQLGEQ